MSRRISYVFSVVCKSLPLTSLYMKHFTTMSRYNAEFPFNVAFPPQAMTNVLAEWLAKQGVKQAHIAGALIVLPHSPAPH